MPVKVEALSSPDATAAPPAAVKPARADGPGLCAAVWPATRPAVLALLLGGLLTWLLPLDAWLDRRHDLQVSAFAPGVPIDAAQVVDVDETTVLRLGPWPLRREVYVPAGRWLIEHGARAVMIGMLLVDGREGDTSFGQWLAQAEVPVILGARSLQGDGELRPARAPSPGCRAWPFPSWQLPMWARADGPQPRLPLNRVGAMSVPLDADGVLRRLPLWQQAGELALPSMPFAAWLALQPTAADQSVATGWQCSQTSRGTAALHGPAGQFWPLDESHRALPWLARPDSGASPMPLWQAHQAAQGLLAPADVAALASRVRGRVVFIGSSAALADQVMTPQGPRSAAAVLAATYDALAHGRLLKPAEAGLVAGYLLLGLLPWAASLCVRTRSARPRPLVPLLAVGLALAILLAADSALVAWRAQFSQIGWPVAMLLLMAAAELWRWQRGTVAEHRRLRVARAELIAANQVKSDFLAHVSHEIRTPLNALLGAAELLEQTPLDLAQRRHVRLFSSAGQELMQMLSDLLDLSKLEAGLLTLRREPLSLSRLVAQQVLLFEARASLKGLSLSVDAHPDLPEHVIGDATRLAQVLRNLLSNAVKFTSVGKVTLMVGFGRQTHELRFAVHDTGIGVPADRADRLFKPYQQAHEALNQGYGGTGLGLSISRRLVEAMGGTIGLRSREGLGSTFYFELPLPATSARPADSHAADAMSAQRAPLQLLPESGHHGHHGHPERRVLVADDSMHNLVLAEACLDGQGLQVDCVQDGAAALRRFERTSYRVVLLDLNMPVMDGLQTVRAMRELEQRRGRRPALIIAQTGRSDSADLAQARAAGFDLHLAKPYSRAQLLAALANGLDVDGAAASPTSAQAQALTTAPDLREAISQLPDSDLPSAVQRMGNATLYDRVLDVARAPLLAFEQRLAQALDTVPCDLELALRLAHDLQALAATLGLPGLASEAQRLERALAVTVLPAEDAAVHRGRQAVLQRLAELTALLAAGARAGTQPRR